MRNIGSRAKSAHKAVLVFTVLGMIATMLAIGALDVPVAGAATTPPIAVGDGDPCGPDDWDSTLGVVVVDDIDSTPTGGINFDCAGGTGLTDCDDGNSGDTIVPNNSSASKAFDTDRPRGVTTGSSSGQDLCQSMWYTEFDTDGDLWVCSAITAYGGSEGVFIFEFNQVDGFLLDNDILVVAEVNSNAAPDIRVFKYDSTSGMNQGWGNETATTTAYFASTFSNDEELFVEGCLNLTDLGVVEPTSCLAFTSGSVYTGTGNAQSGNYQLKDTMGAAAFSPESVPCGTLVVEKVTVPSAAAGPFTYTIDGAAPVIASSTGLGVDSESDDTDGLGSLAAGGTSETFTDVYIGDYVVVEIDAGPLWETQTVDCDPDTAGDQGTATVTAAATTTCVITNTQAPDIAVDKTASPETLPEPGGDVVFTAVITNTGGDGTLDSLIDSIHGDLSPGVGLSVCVDGNGVPAVGQTIVSGTPLTCSFTVNFDANAGFTETDVITATVGSSTADDDAVVTITDVLPMIGVTKTANPTSVPEPGGDVTFTFEVMNTSPEPVTLLSLNDSVYGNLDGQGDCALTPTVILAANGGTYSCSITKMVTGDALSTHTNIVTAAAADDDGNDVNGEATAVVTISDVLPSVAVAKSANPSSVPETGGDVSFTFVVTNTSTEDVTLDSLIDDKLGDLDGQGTCVADGSVTIVPGSPYSCSVTVNLTGQPDTPHVNVVKATVSDDDGNGADGEATATVTFTDVLPSVAVAKSANPSSVPETGGDVSFTFVVTNTSTEDVTLDSLIDDKLGDLDGQGTCVADGSVTIVPGSPYSCSVTVNLTGQPDTPHVNVVKATVSDDDGNGADGEATATVTFEDIPATIRVDKSANPTQVLEPGDDVAYTFLVQNESAYDVVTINELDDSIYGDLDGQGDCETPFDLDPQEIYTCSATFAVPGNFGDTIVNVLSVTGVDDDGEEVTGTDDATVTITNVPSMIEVEKSADPEEVDEPGANVTFTFVVDNTSTTDPVTINELFDSIYGDLNGLGTCLTPQDIPVGGTYECEITEFVSGNAGAMITNVLTVTGVDDDGGVVSGSDDADVTINDLPSSILVTKTAGLDEVPASGGEVEFTVDIANTSVADVVTINTVIDDVFGDVSASCLPALPVDLNPGDALQCVFVEVVSGDHTADHRNVVTATGVDDDDVPVEDDDDAEIDILEVALDTEKIFVDWIDVDLSLTATEGDILVYDIIVTNAGEAPLNNITVVDSLTGDSTICLTPTAVDDTCELLGVEYTLEQADIDAGTVSNTGTGDSDETPPDDSVVDVPLEQISTMDVVKTFTGQANNGADENVIEVGDLLNYDITATNTGNVTLTNVLVSDDLTGTVDEPCAASLAPGDSCSVSVTYDQVTQSDIDSAVVVNEATVVAQPPGDVDPIEETDTVDVPVAPTPGIELVKTGSLVVAEAGFPVVGDTIEWSFDISNTGNITLVSLDLSDELEGLSDPVCDWNGSTVAVDQVAPLEVGQTVACSATTTLTQADIDAGGISNTALVSGELPPIVDPPDKPTDSDDDTVPVPAVPFIVLVKTADPSQGVLVGSTVTYTLIGSNEGNVTLTEVAVSDPLLGTDGNAMSCAWPNGEGVLAPGESVTCVGDYVVSSDDVVDGQVINIGAVTGTPPIGDPVQDTAELPIPVTPPTQQVVTIVLPSPVADPLPPAPPVVEPDEVLEKTILAVTGADSRTLLSAAFILMGSGSLMLMGARRRRKDDQA